MTSDLMTDKSLGGEGELRSCRVSGLSEDVIKSCKVSGLSADQEMAPVV